MPAAKMVLKGGTIFETRNRFIDLFIGFMRFAGRMCAEYRFRRGRKSANDSSIPDTAKLMAAAFFTAYAEYTGRIAVGT